jgi:hypothetical protein
MMSPWSYRELVSIMGQLVPQWTKAMIQRASLDRDLLRTPLYRQVALLHPLFDSLAYRPSLASRHNSAS